MSFVAGLLRRLLDDRQVSLATAASEVYTVELYQYHGWITSAAFTVALKVSQTCTFFLTAEHAIPRDHARFHGQHTFASTLCCSSRWYGKHC